MTVLDMVERNGPDSEGCLHDLNMIYVHVLPRMIVCLAIPTNRGSSGSFSTWR